jgi:uncharacterized protein
VRTFPKSDFYDLEELLTSLGIGEAAVTILDEKGVPTPVVHTRLVAPKASMSPAADVPGLAARSPLAAKYGTRLDRQSAHEVLAGRMEASALQRDIEQALAEAEKSEKSAAKARTATPRKSRAQPAAGGNPVLDFLSSRQGQALGKEVVRGVFGMLKKGR